ncbi:MAG: 4-coumarate--CoA ligase family protein [Acidobacteria bacterium]|nr:4-coumarate--CoA ligase family protein [Acidobacteriota bacterium]
MIYTSPFPTIEIPLRPLHDMLLERVDQWPDKPALIDGPSGRALSYAQLRGAVRAVAGGLAARGFSKGDVFAIFSPNLPEYAVAFHGVAMAGGAVTTMNPLYTAEEVHRQLSDSGAKFLLTIPQFLTSASEGARGTDVEEIFVFGEAEAATPFATLLGGGDPPAIEFDPREDLVALPYSSGTTGMPKGVMLTHFNLVANLSQIDAVEGIDSDSVLIGILPFYHIYGMTVIMNAALRAGATIVTMPRFDLEQFLGLIQQYKVTTGYLVPPIVLALAKHPAVDQFDISSLRDVMSGAAPLPESVAKGAATRNNMLVRQGYGLTESSPVTHTNPMSRELRITSVGTSLPNTEWRIVDIETGEDAAAGELGEVWVRGPQVMKGYLHNEEATRSMIDADGWLHTGDIGKADADGYLYVVDRLKELIKYKGFPIAPAELEAAVQSHPAVADAAVIPSPDEEAGEVPKAFVVLRPGSQATADDIMSHVARHVAPHKKVRRVEFVEAIPKVPSGKILRRQLVERERARA